MNLSDFPFDVPVILGSVDKNKNLQNPVGTTKARCLTQNRDVYEQMILHRRPNDKVAIQSMRNKQFLQVRKNGDCAFDSLEINEQSLFSLETNDACDIYFVSSFCGKVLACDEKLHAWCVSGNRGQWERWRIVEPRVAAVPVSRALPAEYLKDLVIELAKCGKNVDEIEEIINRMFGAEAA